MKKFFFVALPLSLALIFVMPGATLAADNSAAPPLSDRTLFHATATIEYIGEGEVTPAGQIWIVKNRPMGGTISGDVLGTYEAVYDGIIKQDQSGAIRGTLDINTEQGDIYGKMNAQLGATSPIGVVVLEDGSPHIVLHGTMSGNFNFRRGTDKFSEIKGIGKLNGDSYPILDTEMTHVIALCDGTSSVFLFTGNPENPIDWSNPVYPSSLLALNGWIRL
jgi:hypothetical protein